MARDKSVLNNRYSSDSFEVNKLNMPNFTELEANGAVCSWIAKAMPSEAKTVFTWYFAMGIVNILLAITASCGNIVTLVAFQKQFTLHSPSRVLFRSLAISDVCVGLLSQPLFAASLLLIGYGRRWDICLVLRHSTYIVSTTLCGVSLLTVTAISMDRLLVLILKFKYRIVVTGARMKAVVACFWITSLVTSIAYLKSRRFFFVVTALVIMCSVVISAFSYSTIFFILRRHQNKISEKQGRVNRFQLKRSLTFRKTVFSALWVHFALVVCYLPFSVVEVMATKAGTTLPLFIAGTCLSTLIYFNSTINPFLYCWRIKEVRLAVKKTIHSCF